MQKQPHWWNSFIFCAQKNAALEDSLTQAWTNLFSFVFPHNTNTGFECFREIERERECVCVCVMRTFSSHKVFWVREILSKSTQALPSFLFLLLLSFWVLKSGIYIRYKKFSCFWKIRIESSESRPSNARVTISKSIELSNEQNRRQRDWLRTVYRKSQRWSTSY